MLALNSYGLARSSNQHSSNQHVALPPLVFGAPCAQQGRQARSLGKLEMMRVPGHPLYRTTTGYDYGRYLDFQDVTLSCPKHAKQVGFTKTFLDGPYEDSSLTSIDNSKLRAESWQKKVMERSHQMKQKYEEIQQKLEVKKEIRRRAREQRRHEMETFNRAATVIEAHVRGMLVRRRLYRQLLERQIVAARKIQHAYRSTAQVRHAKQELATRKRVKLDVFVTRMQRAGRKYLERLVAKHELQQRREIKKRLQLEWQQRMHEQRNAAARDIQRLLRGHMARKMSRQVSSTFSAGEKEEKDTTGRTAKNTKLKSSPHNKALTNLRRRQRSVHRISLSTPPAK